MTSIKMFNVSGKNTFRNFIFKILHIMGGLPGDVSEDPVT